MCEGGDPGTAHRAPDAGPSTPACPPRHANTHCQRRPSTWIAPSVTAALLHAALSLCGAWTALRSERGANLFFQRGNFKKDHGIRTEPVQDRRRSPVFAATCLFGGSGQAQLIQAALAVYLDRWELVRIRNWWRLTQLCQLAGGLCRHRGRPLRDLNMPARLDVHLCASRSNLVFGFMREGQRDREYREKKQATIVLWRLSAHAGRAGRSWPLVAWSCWSC